MSVEPQLQGTEPLGTTSAEPSLVRDLLRSDVYPSEIAGRVELRSTHASWVFLTEHDVFKIKRPVDLGFLDFPHGRGSPARVRGGGAPQSPSRAGRVPG